MVALGQFLNTTQAQLDNNDNFPTHRPYLGCSKLGHQCDRYLWFSFRWAYKGKLISAQKQRLFDRGHREEPAIIKELNRIGIKCYDDQKECIMAFGHCKGHCDGIGINVPEAPKTEHLLEFKTMNDKNYKDLIKNGLRASKPIYFAQMQIYMRKLNLTRALFIAANKNNDQIKALRVKLDAGFADDLERKAEAIILLDGPPVKQFKPTWFECKWCDANDICHKGVEVERNCRTCNNCDLLTDGEWACSHHHDLKLATDQQRIPCDSYTKLVSLKKI